MKLSTKPYRLTALFLTAALAACTPEQRKEWFDPQPSKVQEPIFDEPDVIGTLGGRRVRMSYYQIQDISFVGTPGPFSKDWATYKRPPRSYDNQLFDFGFYLNYKKGILRDPKNDADFYQEEKEPASPWILVGVMSNNEIMNRPELLDRFLQNDLRVKPIRPENTYIKTSKIQYGLTVYEPLERDGKNGAFITDDLFIARDRDGHVRSYIKCFNKNVPSPPCKHKFRVMDGIHVTLDMLYSRHLLQDWRKIEDEAAKVIYGFVRNADNDPDNHQSPFNRSR